MSFILKNTGSTRKLRLFSQPTKFMPVKSVVTPRPPARDPPVMINNRLPIYYTCFTFSLQVLLHNYIVF